MRFAEKEDMSANEMLEILGEQNLVQQVRGVRAAMETNRTPSTMLWLTWMWLKEKQGHGLVEQWGEGLETS